MQISSPYSNTLYSDIYSQQNSNDSNSAKNEDIEKNLQDSNQYKTTSVRMEQKENRIEQGDKLIEISETKKTVEKYKLDILV